MTTQRLSGWPERHFALIEARRNVPFAWHDNDCCSFAADAVMALSGRDIFADYRGKYHDAAGAAEFIAAADGIRLMFDLPSKPIGFAQRGDLVIAMLDGRETVGVVVGNGTWCAPGPDGLVFRPMAEVIEVMAV
jgi:hypothetical protein